MLKLIVKWFINSHTQLRDMAKKLQELLCMLGSKIVLDITRQNVSEVSRNSEGDIGRESGLTGIQETGRSDIDSDSNNYHNVVLDIDEAERERVDSSRMLTILQKESRSRNVSRVKRSRASVVQKARGSSVSSISGEEENVDATRSKVNGYGPNRNHMWIIFGSCKC